MFRSLKISEKLQDSAGIASTCNNMGVVYSSQKNYTLALQYYQRSMKMKRALGRKKSMASTIHNMGNIYRWQGKYGLAMEYSLKAAKIKKEIGNQYGLANSYGQIGNIYEDQGKYNLAIGYYKQALDICYQVKRPGGIAESEINLGTIYTLTKQFGVAKKHLDKGLMVAQQIAAHDLVADAYLGLTNWFKAQSDFEQAFAYHQKYTNLKDSLFNSQKSRQVAEMQVLYETEKKDLENQTLKNEKARQKAVINQQRIITLLVVVALVVSMVLAYNLFRQRQQKQKVNELLKQKNEEIFTTNDILAELNLRLETKNKDITASISYAQHIQKAIFPSEGKLQQMFAHSFVYFNSLEVVSGDFYWLAELNAEQTGSFDKQILAVVDCTGHGVPGAFMSLIATVLLKEIVHMQHIHSPESILNEMHRKIRRTLKQNQNYNRDGMEIGLIVLEPEAHTLEFAGARRPLLYIQNQQVHTIGGDRLPIGGEQREQERRFTKHTLYLREPLILYLFSDGYQDQFGGMHNKKMGSQKLSQLLEEIHHLPMQKQQQLLEERFEQWKGENPQTDDVMVCGVKLGE
jgi:serine phosphatase RsbU (regulator of sigma subunit)